MLSEPGALVPRSIGRYLLFGEIASGGMATVHLGRLSGPAGFTRTVAIKRLHPNYAKDPEFVAMFLDEARLAARVRHPNVVPTLDVVATAGEIFLVMEYVQGESLAKLRLAAPTKGKPTDPRLVATVMSGVLHGLHAAHEARNEQGELLNIVHRDVSPHNLIVGVDGVPRVLDFGVAKAIGRVHTTTDGRIKGKFAYMSPDQLHGGRVTRQADVYGAAVVTWEMLTGQRLFRGENQGALIAAVLQQQVLPPSAVASEVPAAFDAIVMRGLARDPEARHATAREMAIELERAAGIVSPSQVGDWVESLAHDELAKRAALIVEIEGQSSSDPNADSLRVTQQRPPSSSVTSDGERRLMSPHPTVADRPAAHSDTSPVAVSTSAPAVFRKRAVIAAGMGSGIVAIALLLGVTLLRGPTRAASAATLGSSASSEIPSAGASSISVSVLAPATTMALPAEAVPPEPQPTEKAAPSATSARAVAPRPTVQTPRPQQISSRRECDTPFTVDAVGHKHFKAACLQ